MVVELYTYGVRFYKILYHSIIEYAAMSNAK